MPLGRAAAALCCALAAVPCASGAVAQPPEPSAAPGSTAPGPSAATPGSTPAPAPPSLGEPAHRLEPSTASPPKENPWSAGVSPESRRAAEALFHEGNVFLRESIFVSAAGKYREALGHWDHPNIHFNLALALINLDQPVDTHAQLLAAMRHGAEPLGKERYDHARNYLALLERQLARVTIRCDVPGAQVALDGANLFEPPGAFEGFVRAGRRTLVASKEGFVTNQSVRTLEGGTASTIELPLKTAEELTRTDRRWATWMPWTVVGAGAAAVLAGAAMQYGANQKIDWVDGESASRCPPPSGCPSEPADIAAARTQAERLQTAAVAAYVVGGAAVVTGSVLVWLNRGHTYVLPYEDPPRALARTTLEVAPILDPRRPGLAATLRF